MASTQAPTTGMGLTHVRDTDYPELGLALRTDRKGSESDLVRCFLTELPWEVPYGNHLTVFEQPRLDSGFPDIVFVLWDTEKTSSWPDQRRALTPADVRIAHHLVTSGPAKLAQLLMIFGRWVLDSIERLSAAQMIYCKTGRWRARRLDRIFAVNQIVAFEAKMDAPSEALAQASRNRWFASHSYIIVPKKLRDSRPIQKANQFGVGVWSFQSEAWVCHVPSVVESIPRSYASWLFNEWVWRLAKLATATLTGVQP
jgi:hypothetical protein